MAEYFEREALLEALENADPDVYEDYGDGTVDWGFGRKNIQDMINGITAADVVPVVHGRCPICSGQEVLAQDCDNGYSVEVDAEQGEMSIWQGDTCLTVISIDYCPNCGVKMDGGADNAAD